MQTQKIDNLYCDCGKPTSAIIFEKNKKICIHFTRKSIYWHICENGKIKRIFKKPSCWN